MARTHNPGIGNAPVLPAPKDPTRPVCRYLMRNWWRKAETLAKLDPEKGRGWHSLRRKFASDLMVSTPGENVPSMAVENVPPAGGVSS